MESEKKEIKKCPRCLAENSCFAVYCQKCGARLEDEKEAGGMREKVRREVHVNFLFNGQLYESIITPEGSAAFLTYREGEGFKIEKELVIVDERGETVIIQPADSKHVPYRQYVLCGDLSETVNPGEIWEKVVNFIKKRVVAPIEYINLFAFDVFLSYFQERIDAVHYLYLVGDTESGKTRVLNVLGMLGFRPLETVDMPPADIYEYLGRNESLCRGIILEDEAEDLVSDSEKRRIWKAGYKRGAVVPRISIAERTGERRQQFYNVYCFKAAAAEKTPEGAKAKGLLERCIILSMLHGVPERKDLTEEDWGEAQSIRFELLKMRLKYFNKIKTEEEYHILVDFDGEMRRIRLKGRDRELFAPVLTLGSFLGKRDEAERVASFFLSQRLKAKIQAHEYYISKALIKLIEEKKKIKETEQIEYIEFTPTEGFEALKEVVDGEFDETGEAIKSPLLEGRITKDYFGKRLKDVFKGEKFVSKRDGQSVRVWRVKVENIRAVLSKYDWFEEAEKISEIQAPIEKVTGVQAPFGESGENLGKATPLHVLHVPGGVPPSPPSTPVTPEKPPVRESRLDLKEGKEEVHPPEPVERVEPVASPRIEAVSPKEAQIPVTFAEAPKISVFEWIMKNREQMLRWCEAYNLAFFVLYRRLLLGEIKEFTAPHDLEELASKIFVDESLKSSIKAEMEKYKGLPPVYSLKIRLKEGRIVLSMETNTDVLSSFHNLLSGYLEAEKKRRRLYETPPIKAAFLTSQFYPSEKCYFCGSQPIKAQLTYEGGDWALVCEKCLEDFKSRFSFPIEDVRVWREKKRQAS